MSILHPEDKDAEIKVDRIYRINEGIEEYLYQAYIVTKFLIQQFQGDIKLTVDQADALVKDATNITDRLRKKRQAFKNKDFPRTLWPKTQPISYYFHKSLSNF